MRGTTRKISTPRRFIIDLMHASMHVPFISLSRSRELGRLIEARAEIQERPGWAAIFVKAFALVARDEPLLRTLYVRLPWPHFFEMPRSVAMVAVARVEDGEECILPEKIPAADQRPLGEIDAQIRRARDAPLMEIPAFRKIVMATRPPLPLRRLSWLIVLNVGRMYNFGSIGGDLGRGLRSGRTAGAQPRPIPSQLWRRKAGPDHRRHPSLGSPHHRCRLHCKNPQPAGTGAEHRNCGRIERGSAPAPCEIRSRLPQPKNADRSD
jgi:hypothetical protein